MYSCRRQSYIRKLPHLSRVQSSRVFFVSGEKLNYIRRVRHKKRLLLPSILHQYCLCCGCFRPNSIHDQTFGIIWSHFFHMYRLLYHRQEGLIFSQTRMLAGNVSMAHMLMAQPCALWVVATRLALSLQEIIENSTAGNLNEWMKILMVKRNLNKCVKFRADPSTVGGGFCTRGWNVAKTRQLAVIRHDCHGSRSFCVSK